MLSLLPRMNHGDEWKRFHDYGLNHRKFFSFAYDIENYKV